MFEIEFKVPLFPIPMVNKSFKLFIHIYTLYAVNTYKMDYVYTQVLCIICATE